MKENNTDKEKVSSNLAVLAEKSRKRLRFGILPRRKFENVNLLAEDLPLFPCLSTMLVEGGNISSANPHIRVMTRLFPRSEWTYSSMPGYAG